MSTYLVKDFRFHRFVGDLFRAVAAGVDVRNVRAPKAIRRFERAARRDEATGPMYVVFLGNDVGATTDVGIANRCTEWVAAGYKLRARSARHGFALWLRFMDLVLEEHVREPTACVVDILERAKGRLPTARQARLIAPYVGQEVIGSDTESGSDDSEFGAVLPNAPANAPAGLPVF